MIILYIVPKMKCFVQDKPLAVWKIWDNFATDFKRGKDNDR